MDRKRNEECSQDWPTYSRLFIVCERCLTEEQLSDAFSKFGTIEDVRIPRDYKTGEVRGVAYIKFSKTSEAANALEQMNRKVLQNTKRPLKVMIAANRSDVQTEDEDEEKYRRLYINILQMETEEILHQHFSQFGRVESIQIQRDRNTGQSKGGAYVKYVKFSEAARAYEDCDRKYRPIFAAPKSFHKRRTETAFDSNVSNIAAAAVASKTIFSVMNCKPEGYTTIIYMCSPYLNNNLVSKLFDIVPGMKKCNFFVDLARGCGKGAVNYSNPVSAAYAVDKLNNFEYPPGSKIFVKPDTSTFNTREQSSYNVNIPNAIKCLKDASSTASNSTSSDLANLAESIAEASRLFKTISSGMNVDEFPDTKDLKYCSVELPSTKPLADIDSAVAKRCFLVCKPQPPSLTILRDIFCRFGDLINVYTLPNKTVGYARYARVESANEAIKVLHGAEICGVRIKVLEAEEEAPPKRKRMTNE